MAVFHAVIGRVSPMQNFAGQWACAEWIELPQGFVLVPITSRFHESIREQGTWDQTAPFEGFERLSGALAGSIRQVAGREPLAYIEMEYCGRWENQSAVVWKGGRVVLGPLKTGEAESILPSYIWAVNRALHFMGVQTRDQQTPFDALELKKYCSL